MRLLRRFTLLAAITLPLVATTSSAQGSRTALVDSARALIDDFNERQSIGLLQRALDPALGAPDAAWARGVQLLAQTLLQTNQSPEAVAWLRWALRLSPALQVDSVNFTRLLVNAFQEARAFVSAARMESRVAVRFEWATSTTSGSFGDLRVARAGGDPSAALQLSANGEFLDEGRPRRLAAGSYRIVARAPGQPDADLTTEVLPGVTTVVTVNVATVAEGMSEATERTVLSSLARVDVPQPTGSSCKVGAFGGGSGLVIASYQSIRGAGTLALQLADGRVAPERVRVAAYNVSADLAILSTGAPRADSLPLSFPVGAGTPLWAAHFPACGDAPSLARVSVASVTSDSIGLAQEVPGADQLGVLVTASGALAGVLTGPRSARALGGEASSLLATARTKVASGGLLTARQVALQERLTPFPPVVDPPPPEPPKKKRSRMLPILGGVAAGGIVAALLMPKSPDGPTTGGIVIRLP